MKVTPFEASVATGLLVAGATWLGARINSSTQAKRERKARDERRQVFEQETLVRLQDALDNLFRMVENTGLERFPPNRDDVQYVDVPLEPLEHRRAEAAASTLTIRVLDDDLRALVEDVLQLCSEVMHVGSRGHILGSQ